MSRGLGRLQRRILDAVETAETISLNRLCWDLASDGGCAPAFISGAFNSGYRRAVGRLVQEGHLRSEKRRLADFDGLIAHYPFKSRSAEIRAMRAQLLPVAKAYLASHLARKFSPADNERHHYRELPDDVRATAESRWRDLEPSLFAALPSTADHAREAVFDLLVRGQQIFRRRPVRHRAAFTVLCAQAAALASDRLPAATTAALQALAAIFPSSVMARLKLKSDIYELAHLGRDHSQQIKDGFIEYAMREAPDVMRALPGFKAAWSERIGNMAMPPRAEHSRLVHKLLQRDALAPFEFLSPPAAASIAA